MRRSAGKEGFRRLVIRYCQQVAADPFLGLVYPRGHLGPAEEHLRLFRIRHWGGPQTYGEQRGHPWLRMRQSRFKISEQNGTPGLVTCAPCWTSWG
jgi:hemoglobin